MKINIHRFTLITGLLSAGLLFAVQPAQATNYAGNGSTDWGGHVGTGTLTVTDDGTNITFDLVPLGNTLGGNGVALFIDTGTGGFASTSGFNDGSDGGHSVVSGFSGSGQSVMTFTNGFRPSYAVSFGDGYTSLYKLANGGNGSFGYITGTGNAPYNFTIPATDLGLTPGTTATLRIFGSLASTSGYRSAETIAGNETGVDGWNPFTQTAYATYTFAPAILPTNLVTFQVDMTQQLYDGYFNPANGDTVSAAGTFQASAWSGFPLTNNPTAANPNIYSGTYPARDAAGTQEVYRYEVYSIADMATNWETIITLSNRSFTLQSGGQILPPSYFSDLPADPSATTNTVEFQIDMTPEIYLGNFNPSNGDQIEVFGSFGDPAWAPGFALTNDPASAQPNLYSGSFTDGNYPGTQYLYKYVIISSFVNNYETTPNRNLVMPTNFALLPLAYFNNASNVYSTPVTFQVDMTAPIAAGSFTPANGDTLSAAGTFQSSLTASQWKPGLFVLTNNPTAANTNVFSGIYLDPNPPGTAEQFKFQINPGGNSSSANWEGIQNRVFQLGSTAQTLPLVYWNNADPNNVLPAATTVTFTVNMTNAVDVFGTPFNPGTDAVIINGDFTSPQWPNFWKDSYLGGVDYPQNLLQNSGTNLLFTGTFTVPGGNSLEVQYKYGIIHNYTGAGNTNADNEAAPNLNHTRYLRATGTYNFPVDTFGIQRTNQPAATEPSFGSLAITARTAGQPYLSWLGRPGVYLQYTTNLAKGPWVQLGDSGGANSYDWTTTNRQTFFRLVNP